MSSLLELAAEFFDRMTNPAFGAEVNEEYALRLARLLDGEVDERLSREARELRTTDALTPHGWTWLLGWAKTAGVSLDRQLLVALCEQWESATFKAAVIDVATGEGDLAGVPPSVLEFPDPWLRDVLMRATRRETDRDRDATADRPSRHSRHAQSLLMALLLVEKEITITAAAALLAERWHGQPELLEFFWSRMDALDPETRELWRERLRPPPRPRPA